MIKSKFKTEEFTKPQTVVLPSVISLAVYNNGECIAFVNKLPIYPDSKQIIVAGDNSISDLSLSLTFEPKPGTTNRPSFQPRPTSNIPELEPTKIDPIKKQTVIFIYKHLD